MVKTTEEIYYQMRNLSQSEFSEGENDVWYSESENKELLRKQAEEIISFIETRPALEEGKKYEMWETCYPITVLELIELKKKFLEEKNENQQK